MPSRTEWIAGVSAKGYRLPIDRVNRVRAHAGLPPLPDPKPVPRPVQRPRLPQKPREQVLAEAFPCIHRGEQVRTVECKLCGGHVDPVPVYRCAILGECVLRRTKSGKDLTDCGRCEQRREAN